MKRHVGETELYELERYCSNVANVCLEPVLRLIQEVRERRTNEDKYRWHDLRKNPDDLPTISTGGYIVCVQHKDDYMKFYRQAGFVCNCFFIAYEDITKTINDVIAWREIEPFEEVSE